MKPNTTEFILQPDDEILFLLRLCFQHTVYHETINVPGKQLMMEERFPDYPSAEMDKYVIGHNTTTRRGVTCRETIIRFNHPGNLETEERLQIDYLVANHDEGIIDQKHITAIFLPQPSVTDPPQQTRPPPQGTGVIPDTTERTDPCTTIPSLSNQQTVQKSVPIIVGVVFAIVLSAAILIITVLFIICICQQGHIRRLKNDLDQEKGLNKLVLR